MKFQFVNLAVVLTAGMLMASCSSSEKKTTASVKTTASPDEIQKLAEEVYIYGYPMVLVETSREVLTNVSRVTADAAPVNQFLHKDRFPDASFTEVVSPNADTLYSSAFLDLSREPVILSVPDMGKRYYLMQMMSAWTDVFASPGTRTTGSYKGDFAITGPGWTGDLPTGVTEIKAPTNTVWIIGRTQTNGPKDFAAVREIQKKYRLTTLSSWNQTDTEVIATPTRQVSSTVDMKTPPVAQVEAMDGVEFMEKFAGLLKQNPPNQEDAGMIEKMARLGISETGQFDARALSDAQRVAFNRGAKMALEKIVALNQAPPGVEVSAGWVYSYHMGAYGADYENRAYVAKYFLGANLPQDAVYPRASVDANGMPLKGDNRYTLRFAKDQLPPVRAFWSLTLYNSKQNFVKNPLNRYALGDRDKLRYGKDGSLEIYIQSDRPEASKVANWLPAPAGQDFNLLMRLYWPKDEVLSHQWRMPGVQQVQPPSGLSLR
ncbi:DUF1254 domain-containing protein [Bdellovibrio bacteriovorus]|uniref:DUF1254 domain-containing protein n=1 Tax=Bdellovibrio bacteriovorus TaxID=959 RepID=UPI003D058B5E